MRKFVNLPNTKSLQWKLLSRFLLILMLLLLIMEIYQYVTMKQYLYKSKEQVLEARLHNIETPNFQKMRRPEDVIANASNLTEKMIDVNISVAIIDNNGKIISSLSKPNVFINYNDIGKYNSLGKDNHLEIRGDISKPVAVLSEPSIGPPKDKGKMETVTPVPKLSQDNYIRLLHQEGNLEGYGLVRDDNKNLQLVIWRKIGNLHSPLGLIQISTFASPIQNLLFHQLYIYIGASILVLIIGAVLGASVFKYTLKPLHNVTNTVGHINVRQLNVRLPLETGQLEIDKLSNAFNNMLERIEVSFKKEQHIKEKMRQFISDASHELRTPLTSIHGFVEVLLRGAAKNEKQLNLALNSILIESERLTKLVNDLLLLTKLDQKVTVEMNKENIKDIITEIYPQLKIISGKRKIDLQLKDDIYASVNRNQIKQVIFNLVQNAVNHTDEDNGVITISTDYVDKFSDSFAVLNITDNGSGIPKEHLKDIFDRFFRSESHRSRKQGGYGLGLSIVKSIIDAHNGKIEVSSELGMGTTFSVYLRLLEYS